MKNWMIMNAIKKLLGFVWMLMSPAIILFLVYQAYVKIGAASEAAKANTILQWVIILLMIGLIMVQQNSKVNGFNLVNLILKIGNKF